MLASERLVTKIRRGKSRKQTALKRTIVTLRGEQPKHIHKRILGGNYMLYMRPTGAMVVADGGVDCDEMGLAERQQKHIHIHWKEEC